MHWYPVDPVDPERSSGKHHNHSERLFGSIAETAIMETTRLSLDSTGQHCVHAPFVSR
jgi:hypothetical protein